MIKPMVFSENSAVNIAPPPPSHFDFFSSSAVLHSPQTWPNREAREGGSVSDQGVLGRAQTKAAKLAIEIIIPSISLMFMVMTNKSQTFSSPPFSIFASLRRFLLFFSRFPP